MGKLFGTSGTSSGGGSSGGGGTGGGIRCYIEDVTVASDTGMANNSDVIRLSYTLDKEDPPSAIIVYNVADATQEISKTSGYYVGVFTFDSMTETGVMYKAIYWLYNMGSMKHYAPYVSAVIFRAGEKIPYVPLGTNATVRAGVTYRAMLLWGVEL